MNRRLFIPSHQHLMAGHWHGVIILALTAYFILPSCQNQELPQDSVSKENLISMVAAEKNDEELGASGMHQGVHDEEDADYVDDEDDGSDHGGKAEGQHIHVYPVNLTEMFVRSFSSKKETPVVSLIEDQSDYRDCYACYRLREINGTGPKERVTIADTCFGGGAASMPTVRCYAHKPVLVYRNRSVAIVSGRATPSCAVSTSAS